VVIAVLGLGHMGSAIAQRLLDAGHTLRVWNRSPERADDLVRRGAERAPTPAAAAHGAEVVITSLSNDEAVREVVLGAGGALEGLEGGAVLVDMSTVAPATSRDLARAAGGRFVAAPILGAPTAVTERQATVLLGGDPANLDRLQPLVDELFARQVRCGPPEAATTLKIIGNLLLLGQLSVLAEAVAAAQANGIDDSLVDALGRTPLVAPALHNRLDDVIHGDHQGWFSVRLGQKDVRLARSVASDAGLDLSVAAAVDALFERTIAAGLGDRDVAAVVEAVRATRASRTGGS
jgi:3-hydroxyisobutyrate dehydrogenase-like beta-hydroxyacid dehydrogenase